METSREILGMVTRVDVKEGHVRVKEDDESFSTHSCGGGTHIIGEEDALTLEALQPGDYVKGECKTGEDGRLLASQIVVLRPAWRMLESPET